MSFPDQRAHLPRAIILTLGTTDGAILIQLHTTNNNLHVFTTFINREMFDTQFLWTNIRPDSVTGNFDIDHQTVTVATDSREAFRGLQQMHTHFVQRDTGTDPAERTNTEETEDAPAPPYEPSPTHSYHDPDIQITEPQPAGNSRPGSPDGNHENTGENEEPPLGQEEDNSSERYWRAIDGLD